MRIISYVLSLGTVLVICATSVLGRTPVKVILGEQVPSKIAIEWMGQPECQIVFNTVSNDLSELGLERVPFKDYWNFCLYVSSVVMTDAASGTKWYAIKIQAFNRLKFFNAYQGIPFADHDAFVHRFHLFNEPESITVVSDSDLEAEIKRTLDRFNEAVFSSVQSYGSKQN